MSTHPGTYYRLTAFRCIGCGHVDVIDVHPEMETAAAIAREAGQREGGES